MLAGCGGSAGTQAPAADTSAAVSEQPAAASKLTVWCWDPAFNLFAMTTAGEIYKKDHPDFELEVLEVPWDDIQTRIIAAGTSGSWETMPDIILCQNNAFEKNAAAYPDLFVDLTESGIPFGELAATGYSTIGGRNLGVPFDNGTAIQALRTDVLEEAGYTVADFTDITWDEYLTKGKDVLAKTGHALNSDTTGSSDLIMMMLQSAGSSLFNADGSLNIQDNAVLKESLKVYTSLVSEGVLVQVNNWDEYIATFINGNVAGTINGCWILASVQTAEDQSGKWAVTNVPKLNISGGTNYTANGGSSWGITSNTKSKDLAIDFLKTTFVGSQELFDTILPSSGAIGNWLPAAGSSVYTEPQAFFGGQPIYADIVEYAGSVPSTNFGAYYYDARDAVAAKLPEIISGGNVDELLKAAQEDAQFTISG
ncbi:MAG: extracellular solute-binding protein [Clostridiales bacterium]|nr:extracellular solute-binding protein [Clostridiales bacterium]